LAIILGCCLLLPSSEALLRNIFRNQRRENEQRQREQQQRRQEFEHLSFGDLLNVAHLNKEVADDVFKQNFANRTIEIFGTTEFDLGENLIVSDFDIQIHDYDIFEKTLKRFGDVIEKINIQLFKADDVNRFAIASEIGRYTSNSLKSIRLVLCDTKMIDKFEKPFTKLEELIIIGDLSPSNAIYSAQSQLKKLNTIFPNLRKLSLDPLMISDPNVLDVQFESLENIHIGFLNVPHEVPVDVYSNYTKPALVTLFRKNQIIQHLQMDDCYSLDFLHMAAHHLTILHELDIRFAMLKEEYQGPILTFPYLKKLTISLKQNLDFFKGVNLPELKELFLTCTSKSCRDFPRKNEKLIRLHINGYKFKKGSLSKLDEKAPNLEDLFIKGDSNLDSSSIIQYVEQSLNLKKFRFVNPDDAVFKNLTEHFHQGWNVEQNNFIVTVERQ